ncbi:wd repeat protein ybl104c [Lichtheimia corymbifera JMRC:FSU:9682]|uniref:Wd repeat protein ybl104c n=1 Tax=Lichtheimia corymbifera JMRC:FSU:9682 TaxID=1263082 RepID=A0A068S3Y5_9FUNG|nr:wd repeat protein ybl104c [Lichtheimia corymbifera JMRC:FSU:9682]
MASTRSIIWSPHSDRNQFLVSGNELKLYEWIPETIGQSGKAVLVSTIPKITLVMCTDWCPDPQRSDLIAVGLTTGKTVLVRMQDHIQTDYPTSAADSPQSPLYRSTSRPSISSSSATAAAAAAITKPYPVLGVKMSRPCNVVSFSPTHPHLLAAGLDKVRNDPCLLVWDISQAVEASSAGPQTPTTPYYRPSSARSTSGFSERDVFFSDKSRYTSPYASQAEHVGTSSSTSREQRPIQQYGSSEAIASCAWSSHLGAPLLVAGMGNKYLRAFDIRVNSNATPLQFATKAVYGTTVDPFNPYRVASYTEEGVVKLWDLRKTNDPVLTLSSDSGFKHNLSHIAFSSTRPGLLASLTRDSQSISLWDIQETCSLRGSDMGPAPPTSTISSNQDSVQAKSEEKGALQSLVEMSNDADLSIPVLWKSRKSIPTSKSISCFHFIPTSSNQDRRGCSTSVLTMHKDGQFEPIGLEEACKMSWRPTGGFALTGGCDIMQTYGDDISTTKQSTHEVMDRFHAFGISDKKAHWQEEEQQQQQQQELRLLTPSIPVHAAKELANDISVVMRERVKLGYSMEIRTNIDIVKEDHKMKELWSWIHRADKLSRDMSQVISYNFQGVHGIWSGPGFEFNKKSSKEKLMALQEKSDDALAMVETTKPIQRNLALKVCGFGFTQSELEQELVRLESRGEYDKAAGWAFFSGLPHRAIQALGSVRGSGKNDQQRKLMSAVLAGFQPDSPNENPTWRQLCESLSLDMEDQPYLRAIFAYISSNDWFRVLNEPNLSLKERVSVALRVLQDDQLTQYLNKLTEQLIREGDVEGVLLTGLTSRAVDLLEQTVNRYGDVQTASLVMSFVVPRRFKDKRVEDWIESYRALLDRWQLWHPRAKFDIQRGQRMNNASEVAPPQVYVRCTYCSQSLGHSLLVQNVRNREGKRMNVQTNLSSGGRASGKQKYVQAVVSHCHDVLCA